jgi:acetate kinase
MRILVFNVGSETLKYALFENKKILNKRIFYIKKYDKIVKNIIKKFKPDYIAHRVVHGGRISKTCFVDNNVLREIKRCSEFAPLHNPNEIKVIKLCEKYQREQKKQKQKTKTKKQKNKQIAVFDTMFFSTLPEKVKIYPIPLDLTKKYKLIRYGFHGLNHKYISNLFPKSNVVSCHLGAGCSIVAIKKGKAIDVSMGLTPLEGVMMVTRSGTIDPGIILFLCKKLGIKKTEDILNKKSGFYGLTGTKDVEKITKNIANNKYKLALDIFCYNVAKQIIAYNVALGKINLIVFSGGIGEKSNFIRKKICKYLKNMKKIKIIVVKANEEKIIIDEIFNFLRK